MMKVLSATELLSIWEHGLSQSAPQRALLLLRAAFPDKDPDQLAQLSIGQRDSQLLALRESTLGSQIVSLVNCPNCDNSLELNFKVSDICQSWQSEQVARLELETEDYKIEFRLPNSLDLVTINHISELSKVTQELLKCCITSAQYKGQSISFDQIPPQINQALLEQMEEADPQADIKLALNCPDCGHQWQATFDILTFFWQELTAWVQRILREVHQLASAYGWREADILAMSTQRRQLYLDMISQ